MKIIQVISSLDKSSGSPTFTVTSLTDAIWRLGVDVSLITQGSSDHKDALALIIPPKDFARTESVESDAGLLGSIFA